MTIFRGRNRVVKKNINKNDLRAVVLDGRNATNEQHSVTNVNAPVAILAFIFLSLSLSVRSFFSYGIVVFDDCLQPSRTTVYIYFFFLDLIKFVFSSFPTAFFSPSSRRRSSRSPSYFIRLVLAAVRYVYRTPLTGRPVAGTAAGIARRIAK